MKELKIKLLDYLFSAFEHDEEDVEHYEECGYLTENMGIDNRVYYWYCDNDGFEACIDALSGEIIDDVYQINKLFNLTSDN